MVRIGRCQRLDPGSIPGRRTFQSSWPNWIRHLSTEQEIHGSSPCGDFFLFVFEGEWWVNHGKVNFFSFKVVFCVFIQLKRV